MPLFLTLCRRTGLVVLSVLLCVCVALGGGLLWLRTASGESFLLARTQPLLNAALAESGLSLTVEALSGPLPGALSVRGLTLQDARGPWLTVEEAALILDLAALWDGNIRIQAIRINQPALLRLPELPPSPEPENPDPLAFTRDLPAWLPATQIEALSVQDLTIPAGLLGLNPAPGGGDAPSPALSADGLLHFTVEGSLFAPSNEKLSTTLRVTRVAGSTEPSASAAQNAASPVSTFLRLAATLRVPDQTLHLELEAADGSPETPGLLAAFLPALRGVRLSLSGNAPVTSWTGTLNCTADGLGQVSGTLGLKLDADARSLAVDLAAEPVAGQHAESGLPPAWAAALAGTRLKTEITASAGSVHIPSLALHLGGLGATLTASDLTVTEAAPGQAAGNVSFSGALTAALINPEALQALSPSPLPSFEAASASLYLSGSVFTPTLAGDVTLTGLRLPESPEFSQAQALPVADWALGLTMDLTSSGTLRWRGEVTSDLAGVQLQGDASGPPLAAYARSGTVPDFSRPLTDMLAQVRQLTGHLALNVQLPKPHALTPALGDTPFKLVLDTTLDSASLHLTAALPVLHLEGTAKPFGQAEPAAARTTEDFDPSAFVLSDIKLSADLPVPDPAAPLPLQVSGSAFTMKGPATLSITGQVQPERLTLSALTAQLAGLRLTGQLAVRLPDVEPSVSPPDASSPPAATPKASHPAIDGQLHVRVADWDVLAPLLPVALSAASAEADIRFVSTPTQTFDARVQVADLLVPETADLRIPVVQLQLKASDLFTSPALEASLAANNGVLTGLQWQTLESRLAVRLSARPSLQFSLNTSGIVPDALGNAPPMSAAFTARLAEGANTLACTLKAEAAGMEPATGSLSVPMLVREGEMLPAMDAPLSGSLQWKGPLAPLWRLVPVANCRVRGDGVMDLQLGGTLNKLRPSGGILVENVLFQHLALALELSHMRGEVRFTPEGTASFNASGDGGRGGSFVFSGDIGTLEAQLPLNITGRLINMAPLLRRDLQFAVSGDVAVTGTPATPDVWARLEVGSGELLVENLPGGGVTTLDVEEGGAPSLHPPGPVGRFDVGVVVPGRFFVRGHGIESEWKGKIEVNGPINKPEVLGNIDSVRGTFTFLGKLFTLAKGQINFNGNYPPMPTVDIQLAYARQDFTAIIELLGPVANPRFNLTSQPRQPRDEIISQILFGSTKGGLGRAEALELAATLASLTFFGATGGGFLDVTRQIFGLDVLRVGAPRGIGNASSRPSSKIFIPFGSSGLGTTGLGQQGSSSTSTNTDNPENIAVELGKYVLDTVYVGFEQGMTENSTGVVVTIEVTPNVNVEARSNGKGTEVGATWAWEY